MSMLRLWNRARDAQTVDTAVSASSTGVAVADASTEPSSRRAILTTGAAAIGAAVASTVVGALPAAAAGAVQLGSANTTTTNTTILNTGTPSTSRGLVGRTTATGSSGLQGVADGVRGVGVRGQANNGPGANGVYGASGPGTGVRGDSTDGIGVKGNSVNAKGVSGTGKAVGVEGIGSGATATGVSGTGANNGYGVRGTGGYNGVYGSGGSYGVIGSSNDGYGVYGAGDVGVYASGGTYGAQAYGSTYGVYGEATYGLYGVGAIGVYGHSSSNSGVYGTSSHPNMAAVYGAGGMYGVQGAGGRTAGVRGDSGYVGVWGEGGDWGFFSIATRTSGQNYGIMSETKSRASGYAGYFKGNVYVEGTLFKSAGSFKIDHPLDPDRRWLSHSFVESPDMMNIYNGSVTLDGRGQATVRLPRYFGALNRDFRYQLTPIGAAAPSLHVARKVQGNSFRIGGGSPGLEVSWQITGIRQDDYANAHRIKVDTRKSKADQGTRVFVAKGSGAKKMQVGPKRPRNRQKALPRLAAGTNPRDARPRAPQD